MLLIDADIRKLIQELEENFMEEDSEPKMEEWGDLISDPGNTKGRMTLYKKTLHVYWVLKRLLAKALEQVAGEMAKACPRHAQHEERNENTGQYAGQDPAIVEKVNSSSEGRGNSAREHGRQRSLALIVVYYVCF